MTEFTGWCMVGGMRDGVDEKLVGDVVTRWEVRRAVWGLVKACGGVSGAARTLGVSANDVGRTLKNSNNLRDKIAWYFGYTPVTVYMRKGLLEGGTKRANEAGEGETVTEETNVTESS